MQWKSNDELRFGRLVEYLGGPESGEEALMGKLTFDTIGHLPKGEII